MNGTRSAAASVVFAAWLAVAPANAQGDGTEAIDFEPVVKAAVEDVIIPGYEALIDPAENLTLAVRHLCAEPSAETLNQARAAFPPLIEAWSAVEMFRFGSARDQNRYERLFFWPDRRSIGLRQVQRLLAEENESATDIETLRDKSVAVQGLLALEYVLFGEGSEAMATDPPESYRCHYGATIAAAVTAVAEITDDWRAPTGFANVMIDVGPENPLYRTHSEAMQQLLQSAREQLQFVRDLKLARPLRDNAAAANPKAAPFWRSNLTERAVAVNLQSVASLVSASGLTEQMPSDQTRLIDSLLFELRQAEAAITTDEAAPWIEAVREPERHERLTYSLVPLGAAVTILEERLPAALGLIAGFNSLDGD
ncbi:imelysin family protein [Bauldia sp.]|uniref:imelysin family protein n=1 Tax=Bauldia sp. TaxID=2575872 RepID=UPI003BAAC959